MQHYAIESVRHQEVQRQEECTGQDLDKELGEDDVGDPGESPSHVLSDHLNPLASKTVQRLRRAAVALVLLVDRGGGVEGDRDAAWLDVLLQPSWQLQGQGDQQGNSTGNAWILVSTPAEIQKFRNVTDIRLLGG